MADVDKPVDRLPVASPLLDGIFCGLAVLANDADAILADFVEIEVFEAKRCKFFII